MFRSIWNFLLYKPLVNILAFLIVLIPGGDVGMAIILLTILVKLAIFPLTQRSIQSQAKMNLLAPELNKIKKSGASKEEQARLTFELYKKFETNPFSGCLLLLIQLPIIFALYYVFARGIQFDATILYSFTPIPTHINMSFLGLIDIGGKSLLLALVAGVSQYFQAYYMPKPVASADPNSFQDAFAKNMQTQMKYVFPVLITFIAYRSGALALYWATSNAFAIAQQIYITSRKEKNNSVAVSK
jgi:YidC/Oxa1 family membrane protein insertase